MSNFATPVQPLQQQPQAALAPGQREYEATKRKYEEVLEPFIRPNSTMERMASFPAQKLAQTGKFKEASDCLDASLVAFSAPDEGSGSEGEDDGSPPPSKRPDTFRSLNEAGNAAAPLGTANKERFQDEFFRTGFMALNASMVSCL